jgi:hypothetical protein
MNKARLEAFSDGVLAIVIALRGNPMPPRGSTSAGSPANPT